MFTHIPITIFPILEKTEINNKRYYISPSGLYLPSVTTVLSHFKNKQLEEWRNRVGIKKADKISKMAAKRGTETHLSVEKYLKNNKSFISSLFPDQKELFIKLRDTLNNHINNIHLLEGQLYSEKLRIAGQTDIVAEYDNELSIIDIKTTGSYSKKEEHIQNYFEQTTAYATMYEEMYNTKINQIVIIIASVENPKPIIFVKEKHKYLDGLMEKIAIYHKENNNVS